MLIPGNSSTESVLRLAARRVLAVLVLTVMLLRVRRLVLVPMASLGIRRLLPALLQRPSHQPAAGPEPNGSADRDGAAGGALQLAGKGERLLGRDQPHLLDGLAAAAKELDLTGGGAELLDSWLIAVNHKQADFADGALGGGHGWGGAENTDQTPRRLSAGQGRAQRASRQPWPAQAGGACC